nr:L-aminoadipate-semialdehyde dehydrogenase-phosphopantetheinyl transferase-like isoform X2 [Tanacetum cinerariifolium]
MEKGVKRWLVNISEWDPSPHDFSTVISLLPKQDHSSITRYVRIEDRKRALVSRLLQYALVHHVLDIPFAEILIKRTPEGKPYL